jgi:hypothetical protein
MGAAIEILAIFIGIAVFWKFAGMCKKFTLSAGFKKGIYGVTVVGLLVLNWYANTGLVAWVVAAGFTIVCLFTLALMSETQVQA